MVQNLEIIGIIPARMESTRFPGKPLALIQNIPMIDHVYRNCSKSKVLKKTYVASDSNEIKKYCDLNSIPFILTGKHDTGSDRVFEAATSLNAKYIINIQGDEPMVKSSLIDRIATFMCSSSFNKKHIITAHCPCTEEELKDTNNVKVVLSKGNNGIFYTRNNVYSSPTSSGNPSRTKQIGVYAYCYETLKHFNELGFSGLEDLEKIEIMRWIDNGLKTTSISSEELCYSVDTIEDLVNVENILSHNYSKINEK